MSAKEVTRVGARLPTRIARFATGILVAGAIVAVSAASASPTTVYDNIPAPLPGNLPSVGYEATAASEFGGQIALDGTAREHPRLKFTMSSWGCEAGRWNLGNCHTTPGATFSHPLEFNVYEVGTDDEPGALIARVTRTFQLPYRPSANYNHCSGTDDGKWWSKSDSTCYNGKAITRTVRLGGIALPDNVIIGIAYNTTHYGTSPIGESAPCFTSSGGCPYDALNVAVDAPPTVGTDPLPDDAYLNASAGGSYCDGGVGGTGTFRLDAGCWTGQQPALEVAAR